MTISLQELTRPELIFPHLAGFDRPTVLRAIAFSLSQRVEAITDAQLLYERLMEREQLASTGVGHGVAVPHCKLDGFEQPLLAVGVSEESIDFSAVDGQPVRLFFAVVSSESRPAEHLRCLAAISRWISDQHVERLLGAGDAQQIYDALGERAEE